MELLCHNCNISHRKNLFHGYGKKNKDCLEKSEGMRNFSPHSLTFLQSRRSKELPCQDESPNWNSHITEDEGATKCQMQMLVIAHFLKGNLKSAPSHSLFPNPGLCRHLYYKQSSSIHRDK